jgi:hypothetical protein
VSVTGIASLHGIDSKALDRLRQTFAAAGVVVAAGVTHLGFRVVK